MTTFPSAVTSPPKDGSAHDSTALPVEPGDQFVLRLPVTFPRTRRIGARIGMSVWAAWTILFGLAMLWAKGVPGALVHGLPNAA